MAQTIKEERLRWVLPIVKKQVRLVDAAKLCPHGKRSLERWVAAYKRGAEEAPEPRSTEPKVQPNETAIAIKEEVIALRKKKKVCALKLHWKLKKQESFFRCERSAKSSRMKDSYGSTARRK
jgi:hypothetical protein